jgi:hypothetical protein
MRKVLQNSVVTTISPGEIQTYISRVNNCNRMTQSLEPLNFYVHRKGRLEVPHLLVKEGGS